MRQPLITIAIPTYNRLHYLRATLTLLFSTIDEDVEIVVSDNRSTDGTWEYLQSLAPHVTCHRQRENVGHDGNLLTCLTLGRGRYIWTLSDDDRPCFNWLQHVREGLAAFPDAQVLYLKAFCADQELSYVRSGTIPYAGWQSLDLSGFVRALGHWVALGSSLIVRRDALDLKTVGEWRGTNVLPAAATLFTVARATGTYLSNANLIAYRPGNSGGYDGVRSFARNMARLFRSLEKHGLDHAAATWSYNRVLRHQITHFLMGDKQFPLRFASLCTLALRGYRYRDFYSCVLPVLAYRLLGLDWFLRRSPVRALLGEAAEPDAQFVPEREWYGAEP